MHRSHTSSTGKPYGRNDKLLNSYMWRNITVQVAKHRDMSRDHLTAYIQSVFQLVIQLSLLWAGASFLVDCTNGDSVCYPQMYSFFRAIRFQGAWMCSAVGMNGSLCPFCFLKTLCSPMDKARTRREITEIL